MFLTRFMARLDSRRLSRQNRCHKPRQNVMAPSTALSTYLCCAAVEVGMDTGSPTPSAALPMVSAQPSYVAVQSTTWAASDAVGSTVPYVGTDLVGPRFAGPQLSDWGHRDADRRPRSARPNAWRGGHESGSPRAPKRGSVALEARKLYLSARRLLLVLPALSLRLVLGLLLRAVAYGRPGALHEHGAVLAVQRGGDAGSASAEAALRLRG